MNMMLLSTYMRKNNWDFEKGENGLVALQAFENRPQGFDVIFMGKGSLLQFSYSNVNISNAMKRRFYAYNDRLRIDAGDSES